MCKYYFCCSWIHHGRMAGYTQRGYKITLTLYVYCMRVSTALLSYCKHLKGKFFEICKILGCSVIVSELILSGGLLDPLPACQSAARHPIVR